MSIRFPRGSLGLRPRVLLVALAAWAIGLGAGGCADGAPAPPDAPLRVVCTTGMIGDVARRIAGEHASVEVLMGEGVDPHLYRATRTDIAALMGADVVFYNGLLLEGKMTDALVRGATAGRKVYAVTELIPEDELLQPEEMEGHYDPHVWMDPLAWKTTVEVIRDALSEAAPEHAGAFGENAAVYSGELDALHAYCAGAFSSVPEGRRVLVTAHDAFNYLGRRYGFEVVGIQGISTESEAGVRDIERLVDMLVARQIPAVFVESTVPDRNVRALIAGCRARGHGVSIGGSLFSDAMGPPGTYEGTYVGMMDQNATTIARALGGTAPASGWRGSLGLSRGAGPTPEEGE